MMKQIEIDLEIEGITTLKGKDQGIKKTEEIEIEEIEETEEIRKIGVKEVIYNIGDILQMIGEVGIIKLETIEIRKEDKTGIIEIEVTGIVIDDIRIDWIYDLKYYYSLFFN